MGLLLSTVVTVGVGCGGSTESSSLTGGTVPFTEPTTTHAATIHREGPLRKIDTGGEQMAALLRGQLAIVGGCVVQQADDGQTTIVLWPLDVHWDDDAQEVVFPDDRRLGLGTDVGLGDGGIYIQDITTYWPDGRAAAEELARCLPDVSSVWVAGHEIDPFESFDLATRCGIEGTMIDGVWWRADPPLSDSDGGPPAGWAVPSQQGTMTYYGEDLAIFTTDQGLLARFEPTTLTQPDVACN